MSSFVPQILQTAGAEVSMIRMPDCSFSAGIVFLSVSGGLFGISPAAKGKPHRLHTDTWIGLTSPHCLHFELVIERSEIPMLSNPTVELTRRRESKHPPPHQASCETRPRRSRPTTECVKTLTKQSRININEL